ncbi:MAG: hypothetical protein BWY43_00671 [candidate division WS2 bacterium ADurb.Bin280]|uniref:DUF4145 domain-containing protein n=1 Tax=candidate division WS2 bacterium ADurb.Bin280 TaxID=1852829 RepID=A0A1V5SCM2_9BACT|nr:MAG: hypothetical protein BWY43_00671 [candidate division WS2 bacterium ADurb.Bin280]
MKKNNNTNPLDGVFSALEGLIASFFDKLMPRGSFAVLPPGEITKRFQEIEKMESKLAIIEADKLVDTVLKKAGSKGESLGERLRGVQKLVSRDVYSNMWEAHKVRNQIVHDHDFDIRSVDHNLVIYRMKKFLIELGAFKNEQ